MPVVHGEVVQRDEIRMRNRGGRPGLAPEPFRRVGAGDEILAHQLQRDVAFEQRVERAIDRAHSAAAQPPVETIASHQHARHRRSSERRSIIGAAAGAGVVAEAAGRTFLEAAADGHRRGPLQQQRQRAGDRHQQCLVLATVRLLGFLGTERQQRFASERRQRDRNQQVNAVAADDFRIVGRQLLPQPATLGRRDSAAASRAAAAGPPACCPPAGRAASRRPARRKRVVGGVIRDAYEHRHEFGMQRRIDPRDHAAGDLPIDAA